ncbi:MAG TPA: hypothetical protein VNS46_01215 [Nocardioides sp.]|nr:hypothetical protein [Nocardioides sp.]
MSTTSPATRSVAAPSRHQLALMIWLAVFPTLTVLNLTVGSVLKDTNTVLRTLVMVSIAVPVVVYLLLPRLHRARALLLTRAARG